MNRRFALLTLPILPTLLLAGCGGDDDDTELPLQPVVLSLPGLHDVPAGTWLFRQDSEVADFLAQYEVPTQVCNASGQCVPGHSSPPAVDYQRQALAGLSAGPSGTCETLALTRARLRGDTVTLEYRLSRPDSGIACPAVVSWMTAFVLVPAAVRQVQALRV